MTQTIRSQNESSEPTTIYEKVIGALDDTTSYTTPTTLEPNCIVIRFDNFVERDVETRPHYLSTENLVKNWERNDKRRAALKDARSWIADTFHADDGATVRTLRLRKGWSQMQLAQKLKTSQSHIARIERGTENIAIDTCRRLCRALNVDLNTLDEALQKQESIAIKKAK
jgi:ribosome-binding protein aMBF1 (putative translation factor)